MSDAFQKELAFLGIASSPAFVRAPEGNGCAERFIRTLKENLLVGAHLRHRRGAPSGAARSIPVTLHRISRINFTVTRPGLLKWLCVPACVGGWHALADAGSGPAV